MSHTHQHNRSASDHRHSHNHDDRGDHDHHHRSGRLNRIGHAFSELVGGHSHDAADQIDDALEANRAGRRALLISLIALGLTAALQAVVVLLSGSVALLGDTLHNVADAMTASVESLTGSSGDRTVPGCHPYRNSNAGPHTRP